MRSLAMSTICALDTGGAPVASAARASESALASEGERMGLINAVFETPGELLALAYGRGSDL